MLSGLILYSALSVPAAFSFQDGVDDLIITPEILFQEVSLENLSAAQAAIGTFVTSFVQSSDRERARFESSFDPEKLKKLEQTLRKVFDLQAFQATETRQKDSTIVVKAAVVIKSEDTLNYMADIAATHELSDKLSNYVIQTVEKSTVDKLCVGGLLDLKLYYEQLSKFKSKLTNPKNTAVRNVFAYGVYRLYQHLREGIKIKDPENLEPLASLLQAASIGNAEWLDKEYYETSLREHSTAAVVMLRERIQTEGFDDWLVAFTQQMGSSDSRKLSLLFALENLSNASKLTVVYPTLIQWLSFGHSSEERASWVTENITAMLQVGPAYLVEDKEGVRAIHPDLEARILLGLRSPQFHDVVFVCDILMGHHQFYGTPEIFEDLFLQMDKAPEASLALARLDPAKAYSYLLGRISANDAPSDRLVWFGDALAIAEKNLNAEDKDEPFDVTNISTEDLLRKRRENSVMEKRRQELQARIQKINSQD